MANYIPKLAWILEGPGVFDFAHAHYQGRAPLILKVRFRLPMSGEEGDSGWTASAGSRVS